MPSFFGLFFTSPIQPDNKLRRGRWKCGAVRAAAAVNYLEEYADKTRWWNTASIPGIATGVILAVSRALGETAPLLLVGATVLVTAVRPQEEFQALAFAGIVVLLVVLLAMNSFAIWLRNRYEQRW